MLFLAMSFFWGFPPSFLKKGALYISQPLIYLKNYTDETLFSFKTLLTNKEALKNENVFLKQKIMDLQVKEAFFDALLDENNELKKVLSYEPRASLQLAVVLMRPGFGAHNSLVLNVGSEDGVAEGTPVTAFGRLLLGHISEVTTNTSKVRMISYPGEETNVFVGNSISAIAVGLGGENMEIVLPHDADIKVGDYVTTLDHNPFYLGVVEETIKNMTDPFQKVIFRIPLNIQEIRNVYLVRN